MEKEEISRILRACGLEELDNPRDIKSIKMGVEMFFMRECFREEYESCTNDLLRCYHILNYTCSSLIGSEKYDQAEEKVKAQFTNAEWQFLMDETSNVIAKQRYAKMLKEE